MIKVSSVTRYTAETAGKVQRSVFTLHVIYGMREYLESSNSHALEKCALVSVDLVFGSQSNKRLRSDRMECDCSPTRHTHRVKKQSRRWSNKPGHALLLRHFHTKP